MHYRSQGWTLRSLDKFIEEGNGLHVLKHLSQKRCVAHPWPLHDQDVYAAQKTALLICCGFTPVATIPEYDPGAYRLYNEVIIDFVIK